MNKAEFFIAACKEKRWRWRDWRISVFAITMRPENAELNKYDLSYREDGIYYYTGDNEWIKITDADPTKALCSTNETLACPVDSIVNHPGEFKTTYGRFLFNWMVVTYAFGDRVKYLDNVQPEDVINEVAKRKKDDILDEHGDIVENAESGLDAPIYAYEIAKFVKATFELTSLCQYITPTGSTKTLTTHPDMQKVRAELLEKHKHELNDPAVITEIQNKLVELDKEWLKGDSAEKFYISKSAYTVKRKKMFAFHGIEGSFRENGEFDVIPEALIEGKGLDNLVARNNSTREGSYDRGSGTALGGEKVTFLQRLFQNNQILKGDCGTKLTCPIKLDAETSKMYIGLNMVKNGKNIRLTEEVMKTNLGKVVNIRRPILCKLPAPNFCTECTLEDYADAPRAISSEITAIASAIMYAFMSSMHGVELAVEHFDYKKHLT